MAIAYKGHHTFQTQETRNTGFVSKNEQLRNESEKEQTGELQKLLENMNISEQRPKQIETLEKDPQVFLKPQIENNVQNVSVSNSYAS